MKIMFPRSISATASLLLLLLLPALSPVHAQDPPRDRLESARLAWDSGEYVEALTTLEALLMDPQAALLLDEIALLTGEVHPVTEVAVDGRGVRWSPSGRYAAYEEGVGTGQVTHLLRLEGSGLVETARLDGFGLVFSPGGDEVARLVLEESPALEEGRARLREEIVPGDRASFMRLRVETARLEARHTVVVVRDLQSGTERQVKPEEVGVQGLLYGPGGEGLFFLGAPAEGDPQVYRLSPEGVAELITHEPGDKESPFFAVGGDVLVFGTPGGGFRVMDLRSGRAQAVDGAGPVLSADGTTLAFLGVDGGKMQVDVLDLSHLDAVPRTLARPDFALAGMTSRACLSCPALSGLAVSPDGSTVVFQGMPREDWELFSVPTEGGEAEPVRVTREIQHDLFPQFLSTGALLSVKGEGRHRRVFFHDPESGKAVRLFRNNTLRTASPEYEWAPSPDGAKLLVVAERDGNTVSPERGVYLVELDRRVSREDLLERVRRNLAAERDLRARAQEMYAPVAEEIRDVVARISVPRLFDHEETLYSFGSKYITQPGNGKAIEYLTAKLRSFGYEPELQWFEPRGTKTANVVVRIPGTVSPGVVYAVSAHFDSNLRSPGADDNTSATVGLLEMARVLADHPLPATLEIAFFTGEEAGLLGSREYVRRAVESGKALVGALNNDMIGWSGDHRLDNTIRYSNDGIRDLQHGAAILFSNLITYDAKYYKSTDAAAYYDAYGDIVGGIGSYPILANPHYHQVHDVLETVNHQLVAEVAKVTVASAMMLAHSPSRLTGLQAEARAEGRVQVTWDPAVEQDVIRYVVLYGPESDPEAHMLTVTEPRAVLEEVGAGTAVAVKAVNRRNIQGWDWARITVGK